jgi:hypothetical protein
MARSFREAEEASNAQGISQAALDFALQNAKKNPTKENIAIAKDTFTARQALNTPTDYTKILADAQAATAEIDKTIDEVNRDITSVNVAGQEVGAISERMGGPAFVPINTVSGGAKTNENIDAFALLEAQLRQWGLDSLASTFISLATQGFKPQEAMNKIKYDTSINPSTGKAWNSEYTKRFAGNAARVKQGLNAYTEAEYLTLEDSYADTIRRNNLTNLISTDAASNQAQFAGYMEKGLSATEFADRIDEVSSRVIYGNPETKQQFREYFPALTDADIISYILRPDITMPVIKTKITAAEIGGAAKQVGLAATSKGMAETLAQSGVNRAEAVAGYQQIGTFLSDAELYSKIYNQEGINYTQETAEQDILLGQADAGKKRRRLESMARAAFEGSSGRVRTGQTSGNTGQF